MKKVLLCLSLLLIFGSFAEARHFAAETPSIEFGAVQNDRETSENACTDEPEFSAPAESTGLSQTYGSSQAYHQTFSYFTEPRNSHAIRAPPVSRA